MVFKITFHVFFYLIFSHIASLFINYTSLGLIFFYSYHPKHSLKISKNTIDTKRNRSQGLIHPHIQFVLPKWAPTDDFLCAGFLILSLSAEERHGKRLEVGIFSHIFAGIKSKQTLGSLSLKSKPLGWFQVCELKLGDAAMTTCSLFLLVVAFVMGFTFFQTITGLVRNLSFCQFLLQYTIYENLCSLLSASSYVPLFERN